jgi:hypothetical protein
MTRKFNKDTRAGIRGLMLGCFGINIFMFLMVMEAWGAGMVPTYLPFLVLSSAAVCIVGYHQNKDPEYEDDNDSE